MKGYKKIFYVLLFVLFFIIIGVNKNSYAAEATYKAEYRDSLAYDITITGIQKEEGYDYRAMVCQEKDVTGSKFVSPLGKSFNIEYDQTTNTWKGNTTTALDGAKAYDTFERAGQYYAYVAKRVEGNSGDYEILDGPTEIKTPKLPSLGNRIKIQSEASGNTRYSIKVNAHNTMLYNGVQRTIKFYLGEVTDKALLEKLDKNGLVAYEELLQYAKNQEKNLKQDSFQDTKTGILDYNIAQDYNIQNGKYYFLHTILDNENGTYVDVEDIGIYNGEVSSTGRKGLKGFKYEAPSGGTVETGNTEQPKKDEIKVQEPSKKADNTISTKILPKAGVSLIGIGILFVMFVAIIVLYIKNKQYKDI